uniref:Uncharacterized protein n=1 Tax=Chrysotila carterae TaxID=13221 RepID=A0A7S4BLU6_CHRCT
MPSRALSPSLACAAPPSGRPTERQPLSTAYALGHIPPDLSSSPQPHLSRHDADLIASSRAHLALCIDRLRAAPIRTSVFRMETSQPCPAPVAAAVSTSTGSTICKPSTSVSSATAIGLLKRKLVEVERLRLESESKLKAVEAELAIEKREHTRTTAKLSQLLAKRGAGGAADEQAARDVSALRDAVLTLRRLLHAEREETHRLRAAAAKGPARPAGERHVPLDPQREITPDFSGHASAHAAPRVGSGARGASAQPAARANACNDGERPSAKRSLDVGADAQIAKSLSARTSRTGCRLATRRAQSASSCQSDSDPHRESLPRTHALRAARTRERALRACSSAAEVALELASLCTAPLCSCQRLLAQFLATRWRVRSLESACASLGPNTRHDLSRPPKTSTSC